MICRLHRRFLRAGTCHYNLNFGNGGGEKIFLLFSVPSLVMDKLQRSLFRSPLIFRPYTRVSDYGQRLTLYINIKK